jgi:hypothetical protein
MDGRASYHEESEALRSFLLPCAATGVSLVVVWCHASGAAVDVCRDAPA